MLSKNRHACRLDCSFISACWTYSLLLPTRDLPIQLSERSRPSRLPPFIWSLCASYFTLGVASLAVVGLLEPMVFDLGVARGDIAFRVTFFALAYGFAAPGIQMIVGHWDRRRLLIAGLVGISVGCLSASVSQSYVMIAVSRVIMALGAALVGPMISAAAAYLVTPEVRGKALGTAFAGLTLATVFGVPVTALGGALIGWRWSTALIGVVALCAALWVVVVLPPAGQGRRVRAMDLTAVFASPVLLPAVAVTFFQMATQFATYALIPAVLIQLHGVPVEYVPLALLLYGTGGIAGNIVATTVVDRVGCNRVILTSLLSLSSVFLVLSLFTFGPVTGPLMLFLWSFCSLALFAPHQMRLVALSPEQQNLLLALNSSAVYLGMATGSAISGLAYEALGGGRLTLISFLISLLSIGSFLVSRKFEVR